MAEFIDPVIQNGKSLQQSAGDSALSINRTAPVPLQPPQPPQLANPGSPRWEQMGLRRSNSQVGMNERYGASSPQGGGGSDGKTNGNARLMQSEEDGRNGRDEGSNNNEPRAVKVGSRYSNGCNITDFFSEEVFQIVLHNPTTAHRFTKFCQSRACGENMEFLHKVDAYHKLLDQVAHLLSSIHSTYTSPDASREINIPWTCSRDIAADMKEASQNTLPILESIFDDAQDHIQKLLASDIYPRFVKHQVTTSATIALSETRERFQGLGDCFCMTDPGVADNPILFASDGFVSVTGYSRRDIIPRNCRFLQGPQTDPASAGRLRKAIFNGEETVELILNYRKNGDPFWNLLYLAPLFDERGTIRFFLGGQINVSTTVHSCTDVLKVLGQSSDDNFGDTANFRSHRGSQSSSVTGLTQQKKKSRSSFFRSFRSFTRAPSPVVNVPVRDEAGMESKLIDRISRMNFRTQVEAFYTAYSKYLVMSYTVTSGTLTISHFSPGVIDMLCLNLPNGAIAPIHNKDIFKVLSDHSSSSTTTKIFKSTVLDNLRVGKAVSVELGLLTGYAEVCAVFTMGKNKTGFKRTEERYVSHWTPLKDEAGVAKWVVLTIDPV